VPVDPAFAAWLKSDALYSTGYASGVSATWGSRATSSTIVSPLAAKADADAESARQAAFLAGPLVRDTLVVPGQRSDLICRAVNAAGDRLGYEATPTVFVIGVDETQIEGCTMLIVLRKLA
jgi:hypothetical protein